MINDGFQMMELKHFHMDIKYAWAIPLPNKKGQTVADAFKRIMNESGRKPKMMWVDKGTEFYNQYVKAL